MAKDALGHGSDGKGAGMHTQGVQKAGMRYHVKITPYSLEAGKIGQDLGPGRVVSMHNSLPAAARSLTTAIRDPSAAFSGGVGSRYLIHDQMTGNTFSRNEARAAVPNTVPSEMKNRW
jgi:hypothetical protein